MTTRPILFQGAMVRALLDGSKTQTRRAWRDQPPAGVRVGYVPGETKSPYGQPGDRLIVRENWQYANWTEDGYPWIGYQADGTTRLCDRIPAEWSPKLMDIWEGLSAEENFAIDGRAADRRWRPSIHMPRWASRITLEITGVRVERLQDISEDDARMEGVKRFDDIPIGPIGAGFAHIREPERWSAFNPIDTDHCVATARNAYGELWESINGPGSWDANPWVWVVFFQVVKP